jgi:hypothetical protein
MSLKAADSSHPGYTVNFNHFTVKSLSSGSSRKIGRFKLVYDKIVKKSSSRPVGMCCLLISVRLKILLKLPLLTIELHSVTSNTKYRIINYVCKLCTVDHVLCAVYCVPCSSYHSKSFSANVWQNFPKHLLLIVHLQFTFIQLILKNWTLLWLVKNRPRGMIADLWLDNSAAYTFLQGSTIVWCIVS